MIAVDVSAGDPSNTEPSAIVESTANYASAWLVLLAVAFELGLRESFFYISSEAPRLMLVAVLMAISAVGWWRARIAARGRHGTESARRMRRGSRAMVLVAVGCWLLMVGIGLPGGRWTDAAMLLSGCVAAWRWNSERWRLLRRALTVAALIFVFSQPLLAAWRAKDVAWPRGPESASAAGRPASPEITIVVLLDELSASAAGPIADAMGRSGQPVLRRRLQPVGDGTAKVVPALLSRLAFGEAKPCGSHMLCSGSNVLDFDRIRASRPDIDLVGFYMPYCRISGLRSCAVLSPSQPYLDLQRWRCAALRRSAVLSRWEGPDVQVQCAELNGQVWADMGARVESAVWRAPVWSRGGMLFVHAPLPHPPGEGGAGTLEQHYRANIAKASRLIGALAAKLAERDRPYELIVFSDHPLRASFWCQSTQYRATCPISAELQDDAVPLLVTGRIDPALQRLTTNAELFDVVGPAPAVTAR